MKIGKLSFALVLVSLLVLVLTSCAGAIGPAGAAGPAGEKGATGATGATGSAGDKGATGATGAAGPAGAAGPTGPTGAAGVMSDAQLKQLTDLRTDLNAFASAYGIPIGNATAMKVLSDQRAVIEAAKKEGKLVIYTQTQTSDTAIFFLREAFERKYPEITVEFVMGTTTAVTARFIDEYSKGVKGADVVYLAQALFADILKTPESLAKYVPTDSGWLPSALKDVDARWTSPTTSLYGIGYNTRNVTKAEAPKNYADLLDPKWKGKIVMVDPKTSTAQAAIWKTMEKQYGEDFIRKLAAQNIKYYAAIEALSRFVSGEFPIYLNTLLSTFEASKIGGDPVDWVRQSDNITLTQLTCSGISGNAPHPNAAKLFMDFLFTKEGQQIFADRGSIPNMAGVRLPNPDLTTAGKTLVQLENVSDAERTAFLAAFQAKYGMGFPP